MVGLLSAIALGTALIADGSAQDLTGKLPRIHPMMVWCHLCHASCGQPCNWGTSAREPFHSRRVNLAKTLTKDREEHPDAWADGFKDVEHSIACGKMCVDGGDGICKICQQVISRLVSIQKIVNQMEHEEGLAQDLPLIISVQILSGKTIELVRTFSIDFGSFANRKDLVLSRLFDAWDEERVQINPSEYVLDEDRLKITSWLPRIDQDYGYMTAKILRKKKYAPFHDAEGIAYHIAHKKKQ